MGQIDFLFFRGNDLPEPLMAGNIWIDICENIHLHFRDLRIEFSLEEFKEFLLHIAELDQAFTDWHNANPNWTESDDPENFNNRHVIWLGKYTPASNMLAKREALYWPRRLSLESIASGIYHIHYRNFRIELTKECFDYIIQSFCQAEHSLLDYARTKQQSLIANSADTPTFRGFIDGINGSKIRGWVQAIEDPTIQWEVKLSVNNKEVSRKLASEFRSDLNDCFGFGKSGFEFDEHLLLRRAPSEIKVSVLPLDYSLPWSDSSQLTKINSPFLCLDRGSALPIDPVFFDKFIKGRLLLGTELMQIDINRLLVHVYSSKGDAFVPIAESPAYQYLQGNGEFYKGYHQHENPYNRHSEEEFKALIHSFASNGYDLNNLIVTFNSDNIIRDGHHRAAILFHQNPNAKVWILNIKFAPSLL